MNYQQFYADVAEWINQSNQMAVKHGLQSNEFWIWAVNSAGQLSEKYNNEPLVIKQVMMLINWLEDIYTGKQ
ncbi:hypothetical protein MUN88_17220 [Gracilibacillus caseinilyticus]|uniref:Uncharacterized protein n=1 Tax=Gracilibacillus caseinilyticus TaxID=2932256 RepID=A0ABY4EU73_9BACI|nr:hypothetical protein [Gracilibacillus caseinilyticus]UOQ47773.1 hypothetical protein MUN88_17220 [Gracilibacillus caseinilyticus]